MMMGLICLAANLKTFNSDAKVLICAKKSQIFTNTLLICAQFHFILDLRKTNVYFITEKQIVVLFKSIFLIF